MSASNGHHDPELALLGAIVLEPNRCPSVFALVQPSDFANPVYAQAVAVVERMFTHQDAIDPVTVKAALDGEIEDDPSALLIAACDLKHQAKHATRYAELVKRASLRRKGREALEAANAAMRAEDEPVAALTRLADTARDAITRLTTRKGRSIVDAIAEYNESLTSTRAPTLATGFIAFDTDFGGIPATGVTVLAARPSVGKTSLALQVAARVADDALGKVLVYSLETVRLDVTRTLLAQAGKVDLGRLRQAGHMLSAEDIDAINLGRDHVKRFDMEITDEPLISPLEIHAQVSARIAGGEKIALVVIDYLQLLDASPNRRKNGNREQDVAWLMRRLKILSISCEVAVLVLAQINRESTKRQDKRPFLSDLRESGAVEQDADCVLMLHRPEALTTDPEERAEVAGEAELIVAKYRQSRTGSVPMRFDGPTVTFSEEISW